MNSLLESSLAKDKSGKRLPPVLEELTIRFGWLDEEMFDACFGFFSKVMSYFESQLGFGKFFDFGGATSAIFGFLKPLGETVDPFSLFFDFLNSAQGNDSEQGREEPEEYGEEDEAQEGRHRSEYDDGSKEDDGGGEHYNANIGMGEDFGESQDYYDEGMLGASHINAQMAQESIDSDYESEYDHDPLENSHQRHQGLQR